jgi:hypothetical protein
LSCGRVAAEMPVLDGAAGHDCCSVAVLCLSSMKETASACFGRGEGSSRHARTNVRSREPRGVVKVVMVLPVDDVRFNWI